MGAFLGHDEETDLLYLHGGYSSDLLTDTWVADWSLGRRPAVQFTVDARAAGFLARDVVGLSVRARAGGWMPDADAAPMAGAELLGFSAAAAHLPTGPWVALARHDATPDQATATWLTWSATSRDESLRYLQAADMGLAFQLRPVASSDERGREAEVAVDHVEARVRYVLPAVDE